MNVVDEIPAGFHVWLRRFIRLRITFDRVNVFCSSKKTNSPKSVPEYIFWGSPQNKATKLLAAFPLIRCISRPALDKGPDGPFRRSFSKRVLHPPSDPALHTYISWSLQQVAKGRSLISPARKTLRFAGHQDTDWTSLSWPLNLFNTFPPSDNATMKINPDLEPTATILPSFDLQEMTVGWSLAKSNFVPKLVETFKIPKCRFRRRRLRFESQFDSSPIIPLSLSVASNPAGIKIKC